jgi:TRAP-type C4-dicarboxylate transport system permease small subunit
MERLLKWIEPPIHVLMWAGILAGLLMMLHVTADASGRTFFNHPLPGTTEIVSAYYMVAAAYLPWAWVARNDGHIQVNLFTRFASPAFNAWLDIVVKCATVAYLALFTWQTFVRAMQQTRAGEVWQAGSGFVEIWQSRWLLPLAGAMMLLYLVLRVGADLAGQIRRR